MSPSNVRMATAHVRSPRIMTPSTTAWPPMYRGLASRLRALGRGALIRGALIDSALLGSLGLARLRLRVPTLEALDSTTGVDQLLLSGIEGVTFRAELYPQL